VRHCFRGTLNAIKGFVPKELFASVEEKSYEEWIDELEEMEKDEDAEDFKEE
jgi:hypothetical protein